MPKYKVELQQIVHRSYEIEVEATGTLNAMDIAEVLAKSLSIQWIEDTSTIKAYSASLIENETI